ncbi:hypothetical protein [Methylopila sp. M107]|uniref:hypothetical protein n=1 Tax=Methylopila sp. M107 TaxID=1101190 RepID=UPI00037128AF|nr:hypothetical protein [Methylopila sp. M107]
MTALALSEYDRLAAPASEAEARKRAVERRARMAQGAKVAPAVMRRERLAQAEVAVPGFVRRLMTTGAPVEPDTVLVHFAVYRDLPLGVLWRPMDREHGLARAEAIYWILGLTSETAESAAARFGLDGASLALQAMRAHARCNGLPVLDMDDGGKA